MRRLPILPRPHLLLAAAALVLGSLGIVPDALAKPEKRARHVHAAAKAKDAAPQVVLETNRGKVVLRLFADRAPISTQNMLSYVQAGHYNGTIFHRVIPDFMVQGGGFTKELTEKPGKDGIKNEADNGLSNIRGTVAMARTDVVDSATAQFFINVKDNAQLDHRPGSFGYAVFGEVVEGMDVVDAIRRTPTLCPSWSADGPCDPQQTHGLRDVPKEPVVIVKAYRK